MAERECLFCAIGAGKIPSKKVYENDEAVAFLDINPRNRGHTLIVPKKHYGTIMDMPEDEAVELFKIVKRIASAAKEGVEADGVNIGQNNGKSAGQVIPHVHFHVIPRFDTDKVKAGAEALLPPLKLEEAEMNDILKKIKENMGEETAKPKPEPKQEKEVDFDEENQNEDKDFKKINFDF